MCGVSACGFCHTENEGLLTKGYKMYFILSCKHVKKFSVRENKFSCRRNTETRFAKLFSWKKAQMYLLSLAHDTTAKPIKTAYSKLGLSLNMQSLINIAKNFWESTKKNCEPSQSATCTEKRTQNSFPLACSCKARSRAYHAENKALVGRWGSHDRL